MLKTNDVFENLIVFEKILKTIESSLTQAHLDACRKYFNEFVRMYGCSYTKRKEFERNFEKKRIEILKKNLENERNVKTNKNMALQREYPGLYKF